MRIAIDLQGFQSEASKTRGIGRYSIEIVKNIIKLDVNNDYILFSNAALSDFRGEFETELKQKNVSYFEWFAPCPIGYISDDKLKRKIAIILRSYALSLLHTDLILITSYLEGYVDNSLTDVDKTICKAKVVSIFYDLIPLLNPQDYLDKNPKFSSFYHQKLNQIKGLDGLLAISKSSSDEIKEFLGFDHSRVINISSGCNKSIFKQTNLDDNKYLFEKPFILYTGAGDPRKNLKRLIQASCLLPLNIKNTYQLVLVGKLLDYENKLIDTWIKKYNLDPNFVIKKGYVDDDDLAILYRSCDLFVFPSLHEGFGLPVLEAMSCGAPVIASNTTSIPEIVKINEAQFDPKNVNNISELIVKGLTNKSFRNLLIRNSKVQSEKFSWDISARRAIDFFTRISSTDSNLLNENIRQEINNKMLLLVINKIRKLSYYRGFDGRNLLILISSCIDKITSQSVNICRYINNDLRVNSWRIEGPFDSSYSLSIVNRSFAAEMSILLKDTFLKITEGPGDYEPDLNYLKLYPKIYKIYEKSLPPSSSQIVSRNLYPPRVSDINGRFNTMHLYGWEESEFPQLWVKEFNEYLQGMTVMSSNVKKILIDNGVHIPISVAGLGLNHIDQILPDLNFTIRAKKYKILHVSSCFPRKGIDILIKSFSNLFTANDDVTLIIKTFNNSHNDVDHLIETISKDVKSFPHILIIKSDLSDAQMKALYLQSDLLVAPSRGEGFGLPIGEAMRLGIPVITTNWGGQTDFCDESNSWMIDFEYVSSTSHLKSKYSYWAEPSEKHLTELINQVYNANPLDIQKKIDCAIETTSNFKWSDVAKNNIDFVESRILSSKNKFSKIGCVTTFNRRCGIASYSKYLLENVSEEITLFTSFNENESPSPYFNIIPSWKVDDLTDDLSVLYENVIRENITSLIIQLNYGFFDFNHFNIFLLNLQSQDIKLHIFLHSTKDPMDNSVQKLSKLKSSFAKCARIYVHTLDDLNRLKDIGLVENVCLFPHGFIDLQPKDVFISSYINRFIHSGSFHIATYGFCLPNKGFLELIHAMNILHKQGLNFRLSIFSSIYNENYLWFYYELIELIKELGLEHKINIDTTYQNDIQTLNNLAKHDCLIFPYQKTNESSSAAVRHGIASYCDVLVTPSKIFDDVSDLVEYLPGFSAIDISVGLLSWYESNKQLSLRHKLKKRQSKQDLLSNLRFSKLGNRLVSIIKSNEIN